jgi:hypothetical protein
MSSSVVTTGETTALIINFLISLMLVALFAALIYTQLPRIEQMLKKRLEESLVRDSKNKGNQPLTQIFLGYNHRSVKEWIQWITAQEGDTKTEAFENLKKCLEVEPDELGAVTSDIVLAVANFGFDDCIDVLISFCKHIRDSYLQINSLEIYYKAATQSISRFELDRAREFLQDELMILKNKNDFELLERDVLMALANLEPCPELEEFWVRVFTHKNFTQRIKEEALMIIQKYPPESQNNILSKSMSYFINTPDLTLSLEDKRVIELFFGIGCKFLKDGLDDIWKLSIEGVKHEHSKTLFIELLASVLSNKDFKLTEEQMQAVILDSEVAPLFRDILVIRFGIGENERSIFIRDFNTLEYEELRNNIIKFIKPLGSKVINPNFAEDYDYLNEKISSLTNKRKSQEIFSLKTITGTSDLDKIYMVDALATNSNKTFVYINSKSILNSIADISKLKPNLENNKPCVVLIDRLFETITEDLDKGQQNNLVNLMQTVTELGKEIGYDFVANFGVPQATSEQNTKLRDLSGELLEVSFNYLRDINLPDENERQKVINHFKEKLDPARTLNPDFEKVLLSSRPDVSKLSYVNFLQEYFEKTLLLYGELRTLSDVKLS